MTKLILNGALLAIMFIISETYANRVFKNNINNIRKNVLDRSNYYRNNYGIKSLVLDEQMNNYAQDWANKLVNIGGLNHRKGNVYGENLYSSTRYENLGEIAVDNWYNEIVDYNLNDDENQLYNNDAILHMTQLLWKSSKKLGVGVSKDHNNKYYVVANYEPIGNMKGLFKRNLPEITQNDIDKNLYATRLSTILIFVFHKNLKKLIKLNNLHINNT